MKLDAHFSLVTAFKNTDSFIAKKANSAFSAASAI